MSNTVAPAFASMMLESVVEEVGTPNEPEATVAEAAMALIVPLSPDEKAEEEKGGEEGDAEDEGLPEVDCVEVLHSINQTITGMMPAGPEAKLIWQMLSIKCVQQAGGALPPASDTPAGGASPSEVKKKRTGSHFSKIRTAIRFTGPSSQSGYRNRRNSTATNVRATMRSLLQNDAGPVNESMEKHWKEAKDKMQAKNASAKRNTAKGNKKMLDMMLEQQGDDDAPKAKFRSGKAKLYHVFCSHIEPTSNFFLQWNCCCLLLVLYAAVMVPLKLGFDGAMDHSCSGTCSTSLSVIEVICEIFFLCDIYMNFRVSFYHPNTAQLVHHPKAIVLHYLKGWFILDMLSSIPVELCEVTGMVDGSGLGTLKIIRTLKLFRLVRLMKIPAFEQMMEEHDVLSPSMMRLLQLIITYVLILHWIGCSVWGIAAWENVVGADWDTQVSQFAQAIQRSSKRLEVMTMQEAYFNAFLWAQLCVLGADMYPETSAEVLFTNAITFIGVCVFSIIIGSASSLVSNMDQVASELKRDRDRARHFLKSHGVPRELQSRIMKYKEYCYKSSLIENGDDLFETLPVPLRIELDLNLKRRLIYSVDIFREASPASVVSTVRHLRSMVAVPKQVIIRQNDPGDTCYFITKGHCRVQFSHFTTDGREKLVPLGSMTSGATFGEIALMDKCRRTCNVHAEAFVDLETLSNEDFNFMMEKFMDLRKEMIELGVRRVDQSLKMQMALKQGGRQLARVQTFKEPEQGVKDLKKLKKKFHSVKKMPVQTNRDIQFQSIVNFAHTRSAKAGTGSLK